MAGFFLIDLLNHKPRIDEPTVQADLEVQVRSGGIAGGTACSDHLALIDTLTAGYIDAAQVGIYGLVSVAMIDHYHVAIAAADGASIDHHTGIGGKNGITQVAHHIQCGVPTPIVVSGDDAIRCRPNEGIGSSVPCCGGTATRPENGGIDP